MAAKRPSYLQAAIIEEFKREEERRTSDPDYVIMPSNIAKTLSVPGVRPVHPASVRRILKENVNPETGMSYWTEDHRRMAKSETLRMLNRVKSERGNIVIQKQAAQGYPNLQKGRERLKEIHELAKRYEQQEREAETVGA